jgi:hypothetical protein
VSDSTATTAGEAAGVARDLVEIKAYDKWAKDWAATSRKVLKRYRDERAVANYSEANQGKRFNILWANVQTLMPAIYARRPKPIVERRFRDADPVGKAAADVLERATTYLVDTDCFDRVIRQCRDDRLLPGRGTAWVRYIAEVVDEPEDEAPVTEVETPQAEAQEAGGAVPVLTYECVEHDYVDWSDFGHNPARTWEEVYLVWRRIQMTREQLVKRFGDAGQDVPLDAKPEATDEEKGGELRRELYERAWIYEMWDRRTRTVRWVSKSVPNALDEQPDPLKLKDFFPCPRPLYATLTNDTLIPVPDFTLYQDQARELDDLNARIAKLTEAVKVVGVYDASQDASLGRMFNEGNENKILPVNNWAAFSQSGGLKGVLDFIPTDPQIKAIEQLTARMQVVKAEIYEITGISDIIRGASEANETATAQNIKGRYAALRLTDMQGEVARFARDLIAMTAEIVAEHFSPETVFKVAQVKLPSEAEVMQQAQQAAMMAQQAQMAGQPPPPPFQPPPVTQEAVIALLRDDMLRNYRIEVETDSTIAGDEAAEKEGANDYITAMSTFFEHAMPVIQVAPELLPVYETAFLYASRRYRAGRDVESAAEGAFKALGQKMQAAAQNPPPNPDDAKIAMEREKAQAAIALEVKKHEDSTALELKKHEDSLALERERMERDAELERNRLTIDLHKHESSLTAASENAAVEREEGHALEREKMAMSSEAKEAGTLKESRAPYEGAMSQIGEVMQGFIAAAERIAQNVEAAGAKLEAVAERVEDVAATAEAPREIVRGLDGRAAGVKVGERVREIARDAEGRATGLN